MKPDCWPLSEPAWLTRSICTPGTVRMNAQGSREFGSFASSSWLTVVPVPILLESITGVSASTVTVSATPATLTLKLTSTLTPAETMTVRCVVAKPGMATEMV